MRSGARTATAAGRRRHATGARKRRQPSDTGHGGLIRAAGQHPREHLAVDVAAADREADRPAAPALALLQRGGERGGAGAFGDVVGVGEDRAHRVGDLVVGHRDDVVDLAARSRRARPAPARGTPCRRRAAS